ncbi:hypothetical protein J3R83DRAFT_7960 [Lanmaoa asiatica]|nr:hypothetical protein J3R83DRAFT_7960 [Lanmaoa asiatica]
MGSRFMDYPSPRGVHVPETYASEDDDPYRRDTVSPRRNRYSRSVHQTPRFRDVTWVSPPDPTPRTPHAPPTPWQPSPQVPSSPAYRPPSVIPPSPAPTVGEHMAVDDVVFAPDDIMPYAYQPRRRSVGAGLMKSVWKGLKKLSGFQSTPHTPRSSLYENQTVEMPVPGLSAPSEATQYGNPTPLGTDEQHGTTPYTSPYGRPMNFAATPATIPGSLRASPVPVPSMEIPPITVVSPSIPPSPRPNSIRSVRMASPAIGAPRNLSIGVPEPVLPPAEDGSQTLHDHVYPEPVPPPFLPSALAPPTGVLKFPTAPALDSPSPSRGSLSSTMARFRRFVSELDDLPWVADDQIADEYVPDRNPRSRLRSRVRQGAEPSWYNERREVVEKPAYWSEWDMWAKQSMGGLWDGVGGEGRAVGWGGAGVGAGAGASGPGQWGMMYPHGYVPAQPGFVYPSGYPPPGVVNDQPVLP